MKRTTLCAFRGINHSDAGFLRIYINPFGSQKPQRIADRP